MWAVWVLHVDAAQVGSYGSHMTSRTDYAGSVAATIRDVMHTQGVSIAELERRSGIARTTLTRRLAGSPLSLDELEAIATALGTTATRISAAAEGVAA